MLFAEYLTAFDNDCDDDYDNDNDNGVVREPLPLPRVLGKFNFSIKDTCPIFRGVSSENAGYILGWAA